MATLDDVVSVLLAMKANQERLMHNLEEIRSDQKQAIAELRVEQQQTNGLIAKIGEDLTQLSHACQAAIPLRAPTILNAGRRLTDTYELLEKILLELECKDVFWAQRVNSKFKAVITRSLPLRQKIFLAPETRDEAFDEEEARINPFLKRVLAASLPLYFDINTARFAYSDGDNRVQLCTVRKPKKPRLDRRLTQHPCFYFCGESPLIEPATEPATLGAGSWREMYLTQPPCDIRRVVYQGGRIYYGTLTDRGTMDQLLDAFVKSQVEEM